jgi:hypothetical protein
MATYTDTEQLYRYVQALFAQIAENDPAAADAILASKMVIRMRCTEPDAEITINGRQRPLETTFGATCLRPTLEIDLSTDTLHAIMLGELKIKQAIADRLLTARGPVWRAGALADLFRQGQALYQQALDEQGQPQPREDSS